jgi:hypothetical protein
LPAGIGDAVIDRVLSSLTRCELNGSQTNDHCGFPIESCEAHWPPRSRFIIVERVIAQAEFEKCHFVSAGVGRSSAAFPCSNDQFFGDNSANLLDWALRGVNFKHLTGSLPVICDFGEIHILQSVSRDCRWGITSDRRRQFREMSASISVNRRGPPFEGNLCQFSILV